MPVIILWWVAFEVLIPMIGSLITVEGKSEIGQCATFNGNNIRNSSAQKCHHLCD